MRESSDSLNTRRSIEIGGTMLHYYSLDAAEDAGAGAVTRLPRSLKVLYENLLRHEDGFSVRREDLLAFARSARSKGDEQEIAFHPTRVMMNDSARSEEHTSELQSLMRISYAVFCLKKKNQILD